MGARVILWFALAPLLAVPQSLTTPADLLLSALALVALVWLAIDVIERRRYIRPRPPVLIATGTHPAGAVFAFLAAGAADCRGCCGCTSACCNAIVSRTPLDLLHFSLHPLDLTRLGLAFGLVLLHAAVIWGGGGDRERRRLSPGVCRGGSRLGRGMLAWAAARSLRRSRSSVRRYRLRRLLTMLSSPACVRARAGGHAAPRAPRLAGRAARRVVPGAARARARGVSVALRLRDGGEGTADRHDYGPQAASQREDLQERLRGAVEQIDAMPSLATLVATPADATTPTDRSRASRSGRTPISPPTG